MKTYVIRSMFVLVLLALVSMPLFGQKGKGGGGGGGGSTACAVVTTPTVSPTSVVAGTSAGVFSRITNCSSGRGRYTVTISAVSSCGEETVVASSLITFNGGESKLISMSYLVAPDTCRGVSTVHVGVYSGSTLLSSQSAPLIVTD